MTEQESYRKQIEYWRTAVGEYSKQITHLEENLKNPKYSKLQKQGFQDLMEIYKQERASCRKNLQDLLAKGEIQA